MRKLGICHVFYQEEEPSVRAGRSAVLSACVNMELLSFVAQSRDNHARDNRFIVVRSVARYEADLSLSTCFFARRLFLPSSPSSKRLSGRGLNFTELPSFLPRGGDPISGTGISLMHRGKIIPRCCMRFECEYTWTRKYCSGSNLLR